MNAYLYHAKTGSLLATLKDGWLSVTRRDHDLSCTRYTYQTCARKKFLRLFEESGGVVLITNAFYPSYRQGEF